MGRSTGGTHPPERPITRAEFVTNALQLARGENGERARAYLSQACEATNPEDSSISSGYVFRSSLAIIPASPDGWVHPVWSYGNMTSSLNYGDGVAAFEEELNSILDAEEAAAKKPGAEYPSVEYRAGWPKAFWEQEGVN